MRSTRDAYELAESQVQTEGSPPAACERSQQLQNSMQRISNIVQVPADATSSRRRRRSAPRRRSPKPPSSADGRAPHRPVPPQGPIDTSGPREARNLSPDLPHPSPGSESSRNLSPATRVILSHRTSGTDRQADQSTEPDVIPLTTRDSRFNGDVRDQQPSDQTPLRRDQSRSLYADDAVGAEDGSRGREDVQGTYVNPENPQDRRRRLPNGRLSNRQG